MPDTGWITLFMEKFGQYICFCASQKNKKKNILVWNDMRVSKSKQDFHIWVDYPFKSPNDTSIGSMSLVVDGDRERDMRRDLESSSLDGVLEGVKSAESS